MWGEPPSRVEEGGWWEPPSMIVGDARPREPLVKGERGREELSPKYLGRSAVVVQEKVS